MSKEVKKLNYEIENADHKGEVVVSWIITHACPENCAYCISPCRKKEITNEEDHFAIQDHLIKTGLTKNRYIGGEPLMVPHLPKLIKSAYEQGINTRLSTNGILLTKEKFSEVKDCLNSIALPFESCNDELNEKMRGSKNHRQLIESRIKMIQDVGNIGILVNTCVHKENINELEEAAYLLNELGIDHWKLRKFISTSGRGALPNKERFEITDEEFLKVVERVKKLYPNLRIDGRMPEKIATRLMVSPTGELYRMPGKEEDNIYYGNILTKKLNIKKIYEHDNCN